MGENIKEKATFKTYINYIKLRPRGLGLLGEIRAHRSTGGARPVDRSTRNRPSKPRHDPV